jgi:hypothetical protein
VIDNMARDLIRMGRNGGDMWKGFEQFKLYLGRDGKPFPNGGARIVIFYNGQLVCEEESERRAKEKYIDGTLDGFPKREYLGIDAKLRGV